MSTQSSPSTNIDALLAGLKIRTGELGKAINESQVVTLNRVPTRPLNTKQDIVHALMQVVERRYGIATGELVERKLVRIFEPMSFAELENWSQALLSPYAVEAEWLSLVECLTNHETYFDRDKDQLAVLTEEILPRLIERKNESGDYRLRIWSAGCSSGEETYNLAMLTLLAMKDAGFAIEKNDGAIHSLPTWNISVLGSDISSQMLRTAREGYYQAAEMGSFRSMDLKLWRFFEAPPESANWSGNGHGMHVKRCVSAICRFRSHNLLEPLPEAPFDLILCRNVLIYFNPVHKSEVQSNLSRNLVHGGAVMYGAADLVPCDESLERCQRNNIFWYEKL